MKGLNYDDTYIPKEFHFDFFSEAVKCRIKKIRPTILPTPGKIEMRFVNFNEGALFL